MLSGHCRSTECTVFLAMGRMHIVHCDNLVAHVPRAFTWATEPVPSYPPLKWLCLDPCNPQQGQAKQKVTQDDEMDSCNVAKEFSAKKGYAKIHCPIRHTPRAVLRMQGFKRQRVCSKQYGSGG